MKKVRPRRRRAARDSRLHQAYNFRPEVYRFVGIADDVLRNAGVLGPETARRGRAQEARGVRRGKLAFGGLLFASLVPLGARAQQPDAGTTAKERSWSAWARGRSPSASSKNLCGDPPLPARVVRRLAGGDPGRFVDQVLVPDLLLSHGAEHRKFRRSSPRRTRRARSIATLRAVREKLATAAAIPMEDVRRFYDDNRARFDAPERLNLWRILVKTREEAQPPSTRRDGWTAA